MTLVEAISGMYGVSAKAAPTAQALRPPYGEPDEVVAVWQDADYRLDLTRSSYGSAFGVLKRLEAPVQTAIAESKRLDDKKAPQREAERASKDGDAETARLEKLRLVNKPKVRH